MILVVVSSLSLFFVSVESPDKFSWLDETMLFEEFGLVFDSLFTWIWALFVCPAWKLSKIGIKFDSARKVKIKLISIIFEVIIFWILFDFYFFLLILGLRILNSSTEPNLGSLIIDRLLLSIIDA